MPRWLGRLYDALISLVLLTGTYALRAAAPLTTISWDEPAWVLRSVNFLLALRNGDLAQTLQTGHPGVTTMWAGALSLNWHRLVTGRVSWAALEHAATIRFPEQVQDAAALRELTALLPYAKPGIWLANALVVVGLYLLLSRLLTRRMALVAGVALSLSPYYTALGRLLHLDALCAGCMLLSLLAALLYCEQGRHGALLVSGALAGLATLTRSVGLFMVPVVAVLLLWAWRRLPERRLATLLVAAGYWAGGLVGALVLLWPAIWVTPWRALGALLRLSVEYAAVDPGDTATFFRGQVTAQPGAWFYPVATWFRLTPLAVLFGGFALLSVALHLPGEHDEARRHLPLVLAAFGVLLLAALSVAAKKFDRYALPALLAGELLGALGLAQGLELAAARLFRRGALQMVWRSLLVVCGGAGLLAASWLSQAAPLFPGHLLAYYNPLAGGLARAVETLPVGWGEGVPEAAAYLAQLPHASDLTVATWATAGVAPTFPGRLVPLTVENLPLADYVLVYIADVQEGDAAATRYVSERSPAQRVQIAGTDVAWIFKNDDPALATWLAEVSDAQTALVSNAASALARFYPALPWAGLPTTDLSAVAQRLSADTSAGSIVYLRYPSPSATGRVLQQQLDQSALLVETRAFALGEARRYVLIPGQNVAAVVADTPLEAAWQGGLHLGAAGLAQEAQYRQSVGIALRLTADLAQPSDWHIYARLLDEQGRVWGTLDERLVDVETRGTSAWQPGTSHECQLAVPLRAGIPWGEYRVVMGLYALDGLTHLDLLDEAGNPAGTELTLGTVRVLPAMLPADVGELGEHMPLNVDLPGMTLLGYRLEKSVLVTGEQADVALLLRSRSKVATDIQVNLGWRALGSQSATWAAQEPLLGTGRRVQDWPVGEAVQIHHLVNIPDSLGQGTYELVLNLQYSTGGEPLLAQDIALGTIEVTHLDRTFAPPAMQHAQTATLGETASLLGYDLAPTKLAAGETLDLTLYWQALHPESRDLTVFVHLLDSKGQVRGQVDSQPSAGARPTSGWISGEVITDHYAIPLSADAPPGEYHVEVGLYDPLTLDRLPALDARGQRWPNDGILLGTTITIE
ncbi:MAG: glycosyltransferase family 39 protein [Anaerolineales bacterium]